MAQIVGGLFGLTLTAYIFFADKFKSSFQDDDTYYDATIALLNKYFNILITISITCGATILFCITGIITLHNVNTIYSFFINESVFLFITSVVSILLLGIMLLDPKKLDKEILKLKRTAEKNYQSPASSSPGDFKDFLKAYNLLEKLIIDFAHECSKQPNNYYNFRPQIIQSIKILVYNEILNLNLQDEINQLRMFRNALVHGVDFNVSNEVCNRAKQIYDVLNEAYNIYRDRDVESEKWISSLNKIRHLSETQ